MSIQLLHQVFDETRRLAVAGSATAPGDFRLKKLIEPLKQAGTKAPVFAKLADHANAVVDSNEQSAPAALLDLLGLSTAIRYTQGETGLAGKIEPLGAKIPLARPTELSSRKLQPLLEALDRSGSGRHEVIQEAYRNGMFKDVRLVQRAIAGLDDSYAEIAELFAKKIIPESYGPGIAPLVRTGYDPKGTKGSARRLQLLHRFDPAGTRELVMQALENGSKEVRVAALSCLGLHSDDVHILIEQTKAKAQDVRTAAYWGLSQLDGEEAVNAFRKITAGKELAHAWRPLSESKGPRLLQMILAEFRREVAELGTIKDKKEISGKIERLGYFLHILRERTDADSEAMVLELFAMREKLAKVKGDTLSGSDLNLDVVRAMSGGTKAMAELLVQTRDSLDPHELGMAFDAAHRELPPATVYDMFSKYLQFNAPKARTTKQAEALHHIVVSRVMVTQSMSRYEPSKFSKIDDRWLDRAVDLGDHLMVRALGQARSDHAPMMAFLSNRARDALKVAKSPDELRELLETMAAVQHPEFETAFLAALAVIKKKPENHSIFYYRALVPLLPKSAISALEAFVKDVGDRHADQWIRVIEELRTRPETQ